MEYVFSQLFIEISPTHKHIIILVHAEICRWVWTDCRLTDIALSIDFTQLIADIHNLHACNYYQVSLAVRLERVISVLGYGSRQAVPHC